MRFLLLGGMIALVTCGLGQTAPAFEPADAPVRSLSEQHGQEVAGEEDEEGETGSVPASEGNAGTIVDEQVAPANFQDPRAPQPALRPPPGYTPPSTEGPGGLFTLTDPSAFVDARRSGLSGPSSKAASRSDVNVYATTDIGDLLKKTLESQNVAVQKRNPINNDVRPHGTVAGQVNVGGSYWFPARQDLDTSVSKLDSQLIQGVLVVPGPYSVRHGPGFSFIDYELVRTPRYDFGHSHGTTIADVRTNGEQWHGRQEFNYGAPNWGANFGYTHRTGNDYFTGDGFQIPSSFNSREANIGYGVDLGGDSSLEFSYIRLDQTNVELPGQIFDIEALETDAWELVYENRSGAHADLISIESWYNRTKFIGNDQRPGKRRATPFLDEFDFLSFTDVDGASMGYTALATWGDPDWEQLTIGSDLRVLKQHIEEKFSFRALMPNPNTTSIADLFIFLPPGFVFDKGVPKSDAVNPGLFVDGTLALTDATMLQAGARYDHWSTEIRDDSVVIDGGVAPVQTPFGVSGLFIVPNLNPTNPGERPFIPNIPILIGQPKALTDLPDRDFDLASFYVSANTEMNDAWNVQLGAGRAMRAPTLTELYAFNGPFLSVLQRGGNFVFGDPTLSTEKLWQIDVSARADYGALRFGGSAFHGWVQDYITYRPIIPLYALPPGLQLPIGATAASQIPFQAVRFTNTDLATLAGCDAYLEMDVTDEVTAFGTMGYVQGTDRTRAESGRAELPLVIDLSNPAVPQPFVPVPPATEPLPGIPPLQSRLGFRLHPAMDRTWQIEISCRAVARQERIAVTLLEQVTPGFSVWDARAYWQRTPDNLLVAGVENFTDRFYFEHLDLRTGMFQPGISFYFASQRNF